MTRSSLPQKSDVRMKPKINVAQTQKGSFCFLLLLLCNRFFPRELIVRWPGGLVHPRILSLALAFHSLLLLYVGPARS